MTFSSLAWKLFAVIKTIFYWLLIDSLLFVSATWCWTETTLLACFLGLRILKYVHCRQFRVY